MNGNNIIIMRNGKAIAGTKSHEITSGIETIEVASATQQQWKQFIAGRKEWSINVNYLVTAAAGVSDSTKQGFGLGDLLKIGESYQLVIRDRSNTKTLTGTAICTQCKQTYTKGNIVAGSLTFKGSGVLA